MSVNNIKLFLDFTQSNLNFETSFVGIHQVLIEIWSFEHEFQARNFGHFRISKGVKFANELFTKLLHFIRSSN